jgi:hypothetical protein
VTVGHATQAFTVLVRDSASGAHDDMAVVYASDGRYKATVLAPLVGAHALLLLLDGALVDTRTIIARCPAPLVPLPSRGCGCGAHLEPTFRADDASGFEVDFEALRRVQANTHGHLQVPLSPPLPPTDLL